MLTREDVLKPRRPPFEEVAVPAWGGSVILQGMTIARRDRFLKALADDRGLPAERQIGYTTTLLLWSLADATGAPLLQPGDAAVLGELSIAETEHLVAIAERLSGLAVMPRTESSGKN